MGAFSIPVDVMDSTGSRSASIDALVDTGATYTWMPRDLLGRLAIQPTEERKFILADGRQTFYGMAWILLRLEGKTHPTLVVFGEPGTERLLGVFTLEGFGLGVDPVNQQLMEVPGLLKGFVLKGYRG